MGAPWPFDLTHVLTFFVPTASVDLLCTLPCRNIALLCFLLWLGLVFSTSGAPARFSSPSWDQGAWSLASVPLGHHGDFRVLSAWGAQVCLLWDSGSGMSLCHSQDLDILRGLMFLRGP